MALDSSGEGVKYVRPSPTCTHSHVKTFLCLVMLMLTAYVRRHAYPQLGKAVRLCICLGTQSAHEAVHMSGDPICSREQIGSEVWSSSDTCSDKLAPDPASAHWHQDLSGQGLG
jgi:hypothetical protein